MYSLYIPEMWLDEWQRKCHLPVMNGMRAVVEILRHPLTKGIDDFSHAYVQDACAACAF